MKMRNKKSAEDIVNERKTLEILLSNSRNDKENQKAWKR